MGCQKLNIGWGFLPIIFAATAILTFLVCYIIAVSLDHVIPFVPYISDTGAYPPESCLFSQFLNVAAALGILAVYIRYKSLKKLSVENTKRFSCLNTTSFVFGLLAAIGLSIVGNFQWTSQFEVHMVGAAMAFGLGMLYCWMQSHMTYKLYPRYNGLWIARIRVVLALLVTLSLISMWISQIIFIMMLTGGSLPESAYSNQPISQNTIDWLNLSMAHSRNVSLSRTSSDSKYIPPAGFLSSTIFEWLAAIFVMFFNSTYTYEFFHVKIRIIVTNTAGAIRRNPDMVDADNVLLGNRSVETPDSRMSKNVSNSLVIAGSVAMGIIDRQADATPSPVTENPNDKEYLIDPEINWAYLMAAISEWILAVALLSWFATFCVEFSSVWLKTHVGSQKELEETEINMNIVMEDGKLPVTKF